MSADEVLDGLFHGCALSAFVEQARIERGWPDPGATRQRANRLYEDALAEKNGRSGAPDPGSPGPFDPSEPVPAPSPLANLMVS